MKLFLRNPWVYAGIALLSMQLAKAQIIISQYYEGTGTNNWIELTNMGSTSINTASPQLKLGIWSKSGTTGSIAFKGSPTATLNLNVVIPAYGSVLIGNTNNGTGVSYLTAASANLTDTAVMAFNGNDGIALLNSSNTVIDRFGNGINATDISYVRNTNVLTPTATFSTSQWTTASLSAVNTASTTSPIRLKYHIAAPCATPANQASSLVFGTPTTTSVSGSFSPTVASGYLVVYSTSATLTALPVNGTTYTAGTALGNATVVSSSTSTSFALSGLTAATTYYVSVFAYNATSCTGGPNYRTTSPLSGTFTTAFNACVAPTIAPTNLVFGTTTTSSASGSFTAGVANGYLVVYSTSATLTSLPVNGITYTAGAALGNATVVSSGTSTSFALSGLTAATTYYVTVFAYNATSCTGGPNYRTTSPLSGTFTTAFNACVAPTIAPTNLVFGTTTTSSASGSFTAGVANGYLVVYSTSATLTALPVNGTTYSAGATLGNATVVSSGSATSFSLTGLATNTVYYVSVFGYNNTNCSGGPAYSATALSGSFSTSTAPCVAPIDQATNLTFTNTTSTSITGAFTANTADGYLVLYSSSPTLTNDPVNGTTYTAGMSLGNATVLKSDATTSFATAGLSPSTTYYVFVYSYTNTNCSGGPAYNSITPLSGSATTSQASLYYYFGNFHSHSEYSDGTGLPSGDFSFGDTANCMDFLGISEHNHPSAGMSLANYALGLSQAAAATTPSFLAMYGMEWGVISSGGHVVVYGVDKLIGWDAGQYDIYVPQTNYIGNPGLFNVVNSYSNSNAFATLAHPNNTDYNGIMSTYDTSADDAIVGTAVENGPSTSTNITYSDPPASMAYLSFYRNMLARGYHLGPTIDHDNHNVTHGHTATSRTVVLANSLSQNDVLSAMRAMRFYASQDCNAYVNFTINSQPLGSIMTAAGAPTISVTTSTTNPVTSIKIYSGVAGSGSNATILTSTTASSITYTHTALTDLSSRYYYIDITESDGKRIVTAPIWYTRNDAARRSSIGTVAEFFTVVEANKTVLKWFTANEQANQSFLVERSYDNSNFTPIATQMGKGTVTHTHNYTATDESSQAEGIVYYRLTQTDAKGTIVFSETKKVTRAITPKFEITVYPNPVTAQSVLHLENANGEAIALKLYDLTGKQIHNQAWQTQVGDQDITLPIAQLSPGIYFITAQTGNYVVTTKMTKL